MWQPTARKLLVLASVLIILAGASCTSTPTPVDTPLVAPSPTPGDTPGPPASPPPTDSPTGPACLGAIRAADAKDHVGEVQTVQGVVVDTSYRLDIDGQPTFLNFCDPYPNHCFTALLWGKHRQEFVTFLGGEPEVLLAQREVCLSGRIERYKGKPQIILTQCSQLELTP